MDESCYGAVEITPKELNNMDRDYAATLTTAVAKRFLGLVILTIGFILVQFGGIQPARSEQVFQTLRAKIYYEDPL